MFWQSVGQVLLVLFGGSLFVLFVVSSLLGYIWGCFDFIYPPDHVRQNPNDRRENKHDAPEAVSHADADDATAK
jgi:hypothetical protein